MFFAYLLASQPYGTLYIGSTSDLVRRTWEHKVKAVPGFTAKYGVDRLVWFERHDTLEAAMQREKRIKSWKRAWKSSSSKRTIRIGSIYTRMCRGEDGGVGPGFRRDS